MYQNFGVAALGQRVIVEDVLTHPYWESYRDLAMRAGVRACWSEPIKSAVGDVLGTFAMYYRQPRAPTDMDIQFITAAARVAGIAIEHKKAKERIDQYQRQLRSLVFEVVVAEERQRRRLATDLHDGLGQTLTLARMKLGELARKLDDNGVGEPIRDIAQLVDDALRSTGALTFELSPPVLHELGFVPAVRWLGGDVKGRYSLDVVVDDDGASMVMEDQVSVVLFRAVRELLINVAKHAQTSRAWVSLSRTGDTALVTVQDRGRGFRWPPQAGPAAAGAVQGGFGLFTIQERLGHLGGAMTIRSAPGAHTKITLRVPLLPPEQQPIDPRE